MADIPHAVLSEHIQERLGGRRLLAAVFFTFRFDPGFFEQEVLPCLLDKPLSQVPKIRQLQLEDALRSISTRIAVYYDANGLETSDLGSARLDIQRIPIHHRTGVFHPKNTFLLVEAQDPDEVGNRPRSLLIGCSSANLTRAGWWENVEVLHMEELPEGAKSNLRVDVLGYLSQVDRLAGHQSEQEALRTVLKFVQGTEKRLPRSQDGRLYTHFYGGTERIADFLHSVGGANLKNTYLEVISPYLDGSGESQPLAELVARFEPRAVRVYLPRSRAGEVACSKELHDTVAAMPRVQWGHFPEELLRLGKREEAGKRFVHAKVYRFFTQNPKREILFVGSANLTTAAHGRGGNIESGFLVEIDPPRRPEFWLTAQTSPPRDFCPPKEEEDKAVSGGTPLLIRYTWSTQRAQAFWNSTKPSPPLVIEARGRTIGEVGPLVPREWTDLDGTFAGLLAESLRETSLVRVLGGNDSPALLLVMEEEMSHKPSLLMSLTAADILQYWALLSVEQRAAFIESRFPELESSDQGAELTAVLRLQPERNTLFDQFAGIFHSFSCLEASIGESIRSGREREAAYRLFGRKYDSLHCLIDRLTAEPQTGDQVTKYITFLCAQQMLRELKKAHPEYWEKNRPEVRALDDRLRSVNTVREHLRGSARDEMGAFLDWFEPLFLRRAVAMEPEQ